MPVIGYAVIRSIGCSPMAVLAHETLGCTDIDSHIALADMGWCGVMRALLRHDRWQTIRTKIRWHVTSGNIDYNNPLWQYNSTEEFKRWQT